MALHTCRTLDGGPIPWTAMNAYVETRLMSASETDEFDAIIRAMDNKYLNWLAKKREAMHARKR